MARITGWFDLSWKYSLMITHVGFIPCFNFSFDSSIYHYIPLYTICSHCFSQNLRTVRSGVGRPWKPGGVEFAALSVQNFEPRTWKAPWSKWSPAGWHLMRSDLRCDQCQSWVCFEFCGYCSSLGKIKNLKLTSNGIFDIKWDKTRKIWRSSTG